MKKSKKISKKTEDQDPLAGDLSDFIRDGQWRVVQYELTEKKDKVISLRLSGKLLKELQKQATALGLDTQKYIRLSLEKVIRSKAS